MASWLHPKIQTAMPGSFVVVRIFALEKKPRVASCKKWTWPYLTIEEWWLGDNPVLFGWALLRGYVCTWNRSLKKSFNMCCSSSFWMKQISIGHIEVIDDIWWYKIYIYIYCKHLIEHLLNVCVSFTFFCGLQPSNYLILLPSRSSQSSCSQAHTRDIHTDLLLTVLLEFLGATKCDRQEQFGVWGRDFLLLKIRVL